MEEEKKSRPAGALPEGHEKWGLPELPDAEVEELLGTSEPTRLQVVALAQERGYDPILASANYKFAANGRAKGPGEFQSLTSAESRARGKYIEREYLLKAGIDPENPPFTPQDLFTGERWEGVKRRDLEILDDPYGWLTAGESARGRGYKALVRYEGELYAIYGWPCNLPTCYCDAVAAKLSNPALADAPALLDQLERSYDHGEALDDLDYQIRSACDSSDAAIEVLHAWRKAQGKPSALNPAPKKKKGKKAAKPLTS